VLERPDDKSERFYCTISASEVVKSHPATSSPHLFLCTSRRLSPHHLNQTTPFFR
ncbi:unnamed protein product, partial [Brassica oleracea var. botrytis]